MVSINIYEIPRQLIMIKTYLFYFITAIILISSDACKNRKKVLLPGITGKAGEIVIVIEKQKWESEIGLNFRKIFSAEYIGLPQPEPIFDIVHIPHPAFKNIFKTHRNIIITHISPDIKMPEITLKEDLWAKPQLFINIAAPNDSAFQSILNKNKDKLIDYLLKAERQRIIKNYKKYEEKSISKHLRKNHHLSLNFPKGYTLDKDTNNFVWISHETPDISQGIFVYYYNYVDTNTFSKDYLLNIRDSILKLYVLGPLPHTYMTTERSYYVYFTEFLFNKRYTAEIRGLWRVEGDFMGGPFISFTTFDKKRNRIITVEGYVYAPKFKKRNYLRQVEGILYTLVL